MRTFHELAQIGIKEQVDALNARRPFNPIYVTKEEFDTLDAQLRYSGVHRILPTICGVPVIEKNG